MRGGEKKKERNYTEVNMLISDIKLRIKNLKTNLLADFALSVYKVCMLSREY